MNMTEERKEMIMLHQRIEIKNNNGNPWNKNFNDWKYELNRLNNTLDMAKEP